MKARKTVFLLSALGFCAAGVAFGQAPTKGSPLGDPLDQQVVGAAPVTSQDAAGFAALRHGIAAGATEQRKLGHANPLWAVPLESLHNTRERPLFSASRRPPPASVAAPAVSNPAPTEAAALERPRVTLVGVVRGPGVQMGIFLDEIDKSPIRLRIGQSVRGWTLNAIDPRAATLDKASQQVKLEFVAHDTEMAAATSPATEETAFAPRDPSAQIHGTPVGRFKPFATAGNR